MSGDGSRGLAFVNGAVYTVDAARRWANAVAVRGGRIAAVGADDVILDLVGSGAEVIDLRGRMLLPGFQDAHVHPPSGGLEMLQCNLSGAFALSDYERIVGDYAREHPDAGWIVGGGWSMSIFPGGNPPKEVLDRLSPDRPVFLSSRDGHTAWVNSKALEIADITEVTPDPVDGVIVRDGDGRPAGALHEGAQSLVDKFIPEDTLEDWIAGLRLAQEHLHSLGITAWNDAIVGGPYPTLDAYLHLAERGELTARVIGSLWWDRHRGEEQIDDLLAARERGRVGRFAATNVKIMQDGIVENFTAATLTPYLDGDGNPTGNAGKSFVEPEALKAYVTRLDAEGFQVHFHALADRAVRESLDAIEAARATNGPSDHRHHLAHIQIVHPEDIPRFRELGAVANAQPLWALNEPQMLELTIPFLGPERSGWQYPFASLVRAGATLAMGSDWSVSSPNPLEEIDVAVNRAGDPEALYAGGERAILEPFLPEERLDLPTAIAAFTMGSAFVNHLDDVTGSIEVGKLADLAVVDRNLFAIPAEAIHEAQVQATFVEGERVYDGGL